MFQLLFRCITILFTIFITPLFSTEIEAAFITQKQGSSKLVDAVEASLDKAIKAEAPPKEGIYSINGMSGRKYRLFINSLIGTLDNPSYLEIGTWAGSTLCSAINGNKVKAVAIDNWSEFGGPREVFFENVQVFKTPGVSLKFIEEDFRKIDYTSLGVFNVYLFDGPHSEQDQYDGLDLVLGALEKEFIFIVDDWNWSGVRKGTLDGIKKNNLKILYATEIRTTFDDTHPALSSEESMWHNGYFIAVLSK